MTPSVTNDQDSSINENVVSFTINGEVHKREYLIRKPKIDSIGGWLLRASPILFSHKENSRTN